MAVYFLKKYRSSHLRCSIKKLLLFESLINSEYCEIFKSTYFEELVHETEKNISKTSENVRFYFMIVSR